MSRIVLATSDESLEARVREAFGGTLNGHLRCWMRDLETSDTADLVMDVQHRRVARAGRAIALSPREFDVLQVLMQEPGRVFSRTELCERVWRRQHEYDTRTVEIFIARLRKKVDVDFSAHLIQTERGVGYAIRAPAATGTHNT